MQLDKAISTCCLLLGSRSVQGVQGSRGFPDGLTDARLSNQKTRFDVRLMHNSSLCACASLRKYGLLPRPEILHCDCDSATMSKLTQGPLLYPGTCLVFGTHLIFVHVGLGAAQEEKMYVAPLAPVLEFQAVPRLSLAHVSAPCRPVGGRFLSCKVSKNHGSFASLFWLDAPSRFTGKASLLTT